jgi:hypothetical protein
MELLLKVNFIDIVIKHHIIAQGALLAESKFSSRSLLHWQKLKLWRRVISCL